MDDEWLVDQYLKGKTAYWNGLVRRYQGRLFQKVFLFVGNAENAWDVVYETLLKAKASLPSFKDYQETALVSSLLESVKQAGLPLSRATFYGTLNKLANAEPPFFRWMTHFAVEPAIRKRRTE